MIIKVNYVEHDINGNMNYNGHIPIKIINDEIYEVLEVTEPKFDKYNNVIGFKNYRTELVPIDHKAFCGVKTNSRQCYIDIYHNKHSLLDAINDRKNNWKDYKLTYYKNYKF